MNFKIEILANFEILGLLCIPFQVLSGLNPISTGGGGGGVFSTPQFVFGCNFFVLEPVPPKSGNFPKTLYRIWKKKISEIEARSRDMTIFGEWF